MILQVQSALYPKQGLGVSDISTNKIKARMTEPVMNLTCHEVIGTNRCDNTSRAAGTAENEETEDENVLLSFSQF